MPDLSQIAIFLPGSGSSLYFRTQLLKQLPDSCNHAVLPPWTGTLREWVNEFIPLPDDSFTVVSEQARRLMFIEALEQHPSLFRDENKWQVTLSLLKLFDELNLYNTTIAVSAEAWIDSVQRAYGIEHKHAHLQQEASLIHTLWFAWHQQLHASKLLDNTSAYILRLRHAPNNLPHDFHCYVASTGQLAPCETRFIEDLVNNKQCTMVAHNSETETGADEIHAFIKHAFDYKTGPLRQRTLSYHSGGAPLKLPFTVFPASDAEQEARIVDLQIRNWLLAGKKMIGVISEDRKLSRRLRALLERANVPLQDMAGWSLATTSAAAALERWLECIEEDFDQRPMLDLCKSRFFVTNRSHEDRMENIYRLERDIIQHENIGHGLDRYKKQLAYRLKRLEHWPKNSYDEIIEILDHLHNCAAGLLELYNSKTPRPLSDFLNALIHSLKQLGIDHAFLEDSAGIRIMQTLQDMQQSLAQANPCLKWSDFRTWLGMSLEDQLFSLQSDTTAVQLMTLEQASLKKFDGLIIAAADAEHMPGTAANSPFFNQGARKSLGLENWEQKHQQRLNLFQHALLAAPEILVSYKAEDKGEALLLSPWIEAIQNFYSLCFGASLVNTELPQLLKHNPDVFICDTDALPAIPQQPHPTAPGTLSPERISASAHQRLINCPYQFFAGDFLGLKPSEEISAELKKSDYGERVHLILQAFHQQARNLPAPFPEKLSPGNREAAIKHLTDLSKTAFKLDLEDNSLHRSWLHRWLKHVPAYIDWQIHHQQEWSIHATEQKLETTLPDATTIFGRLDRIDTNGSTQAIIDYKTGRSATQKNVDSGEDVQLASYALLNEKANHVSYLLLDEKDGTVKPGAQLGDEKLSSLKHEVRTRLQVMLEMTRHGSPLHAWGDMEVCNYCDYAGLCRRAVWKT